MTMNIKNNKNNKNLRVKLISMATVLFVGLMGCFLASCDDELDIQQSYPFTVETMPVSNKVTRGADSRNPLRDEEGGQLCQCALHHPLFPV